MKRVCIVIGALVLAGCEPDRGQCLAEHTDLTPVTQVVIVGNFVLPIVTIMPVPVCDRWEFPDGRPEPGHS